MNGDDAYALYFSILAVSSGALIKFCHRYPGGYVFQTHILPYFSGADDGSYKQPSAALLDSVFYGISL